MQFGFQNGSFCSPTPSATFFSGSRRSQIRPAMTQRSGLYLREQPVTTHPSALARVLPYQDAIDFQTFKVGPTETTGAIFSTTLGQSANDLMHPRGLDAGVKSKAR